MSSIQEICGFGLLRECMCAGSVIVIESNERVQSKQVVFMCEPDSEALKRALIHYADTPLNHRINSLNIHVNSIFPF
jgi:hypothetical protein